MKIMMVGDICGRPGRKTAAHYIPLLRKEYGLDLVIANGENSASGAGITGKVLAELLAMEIDVVTSGNHIWDKKEVFEFIDQEKRLLRPLNYPPSVPGHGYCITEVNGLQVAVISALGRTFMPPADCPFRTVSALIEELQSSCPIILLDFHAEATSEKLAIAYYLDGKITAVAGTHTHVQTADERILPQGTAYISDLGMVGPLNSILGVDSTAVINKFLTGLPSRFNIAETPDTVFGALMIEIDDATRCVTNVTRLQKFLKI